MTHTRRVARKAAALVCAIAAAFACMGVALAAGEVAVWGGLTTLNAAALQAETTQLRMVNMSGSAGDQVFISVTDAGEPLALLLSHVLGEEGQAEGSVTDALLVDVPTEDLSSKLADGSYEVTVYADRAGSQALYRGAAYGVWAQLGQEGPRQLIGARVVGSDAQVFQAPDALYADGQAFRLSSSTPQTDGSLLTYRYEAYDEATTIDGSIKYVDQQGKVVASTPIPGLADGETRGVDVPAAVVGTDGKVYRTLAFQSQVQATNPGQASFTVPCVAMSDQDQAESGHYLAVIRMVSEDGVIASDAVSVKGPYAYTLPSTIYKVEDVDGVRRAVTYELVDNQVLALDPQADRAMVSNGTRTIEVAYVRQELDPATTQVTFYLINGLERAQQGNEGRLLGTKVAAVGADSPTAQPDATITVDGTAYVLAGNAEMYAYEYGSGKEAVVNAYYVPEGYEAPGPYTVTVKCVNYANNQVVASETVESSPDATASLLIAPPEQFAEGGVTYARLPGQESPITHSYFSGIRTYTVYYRDRSDTLSAGVVINRVRVVYQDVPATAEAAGSATTGAQVAGSSAAAGGAAAGSGAVAAASGQLNETSTYNVIDGSGSNQTLTNEGGQSPEDERADVAEAQREGVATDAENADGGATPLVVGGGVAAVAAALLGGWLLRRANSGRDAE